MVTTTAKSTRKYLSIKEKVGYALGDTAANFVWRGVIVFLPFFHTDVLGLAAAASGTLLLLTRFWDGITDIAMGVVADRTRTRWGKFRPWILWTAIPFGILSVLTFWAPDLSYNGKLIWAYATYSGLIVLYTMNNVPYNALLGVISPDPTERASVSSYRFVFAFMGGLFMQGFALSFVEYFGHHPALVSLFGEEGDALGYKVTMALFAFVGVILFVLTFLLTKERVKDPQVMTTSLRNDLKDLMANRPWMILFALGVLFVTFTTLKASATLYYFVYFIGDRGLAAAFMTIGLLGAMLGAAITGRLTARFGKRRLMLYSIILGTVSSGLLYLPGSDAIVAIFVLSTITEFATGPIVTLFFAMLADTADYSEWINNRRATGLVYSAGTISMKFGSGIGGAINGWMLAIFGYAGVAGATIAQSPETIHGIRLLISIVPAIAGILMLGAFYFYPLDEKILTQVEEDLIARRGVAGEGTSN